MNQEQIAEKLRLLDPEVAGFCVTLSGKSSKKVDGLYYPDKAEIVIHNKNFAEDNQMMYTAIHEFAHHVQFAGSTAPVSNRVHTGQFWNIFHRLLFRAEELGIYDNVFESNDEFKDLTNKIKNEFLVHNGHLMKEFGRMLLKARELCQMYHASFEDYTGRILGLQRSEAKTMIKTYSMDINPEIGYDNMKTVAKIKDEDVRKEVEQSFLSNFTPDMVKAELKPEPVFDSRLSFLESEKDRVVQTLDRLTARLAKLERDIDEIKKGG